MILVKYASRQRPELFKKAIENIYSTISNQIQFKIAVTCDLTDGLMQHIEIFNWLQRFGNLSITFTENLSKIQAINNAMPDLDWKVLVNMSDDMRFVEKDWDLKMMESIKSVWGESTDFFAHFNDGFVNTALATMSIIGREYYERDRYIYHPSYKSFSCDAEAYYVSRARGRHHYFDQVLFKHEHPGNNPKEVKNDSLYQKNSAHTDHDTKVYWERLHNNFDLEKEGLSGPWPWDWEKKSNHKSA